MRTLHSLIIAISNLANKFDKLLTYNILFFLMRITNMRNEARMKKDKKRSE